MEGGKYRTKVIKPESNQQSYNTQDPPIFDSSVDLQLRTEIRKMFNIVNQGKADYTHIKEPNIVKSLKINILSNIDFTVFQNQAPLKKQVQKDILLTEEWTAIQHLYISKYKAEAKCLSSEEKKALRSSVIDFLRKRGMSTFDCRRILSRLCKCLSVSDIYFHELIFQLKQRKIIKEAEQEFEEALSFLQNLYHEERTNLVQFAPKMAGDLFGKIIKDRYFPGNLISRELERHQTALNNLVKEQQLAQVHESKQQTYK